VKVNNQTLGFLVICQNNRILNEFEKIVIKKSSNMYALELMKQKMAFEIEQNLKGDFLEMLLNCSNHQEEEEIIRKADSFGFDLTKPCFVLYLKIDDINKDKGQNFYELFKLDSKKRFLHLINDVLEDHLIEGISVLAGSHIIVLVSCNNQLNFFSKARHYISMIQDKTKATFGTEVTVGISSVAKNIKEIKKAYQESFDVINFLSKTNKLGDCMFFYELGFYQLLMNNELNSNLNSFAEHLLSELINSDIEKGTQYLITLQKYFINNGNLRTTADELYIHLNTLRYRLDKIREICKFDLKSEEDKLNVHISIKTLSFERPELFKL